MRLVSVLFFLFIASLTLSVKAQTIPADCEPHPTAAALLCADIAYGDDERQTLDVYLPLDDTEPETIVVIVHGGGYSTGGKAVADIIDMAELLAIHGYGAVSVGYRLQPDHPFPAQVQDAFCGVGWIQETLAPENLLILGYSAGGLTASILGAADDPTTYLQEDCAYTLPDAPFLAGTIALYAPSDVSSTGYPYRGDLIPAEEDDDFLQQYSPLYLVDGSEAPFLLLHGMDDAIVPASESENLAAALEDAEVVVNLRLIEDAGHDTFTWDEDQFFMAMADILIFIQTVTTPGGEPI